MNRHIRMNKQITRMKQLIIALFTTILFLSVGTETKAQSYKNAVGVRLGACNGLTFKTWLAESKLCARWCLSQLKGPLFYSFKE